MSPPSRDLEQVRRAIGEVLRPAHFFVAAPLRLAWIARDREESAWEIFRGRLLDPAQTRQRRTFATWNVHAWVEENPSGVPLLSAQLDEDARVLHITRGLLCHAWEAYDSGDNVILSRETCKWVRELVGTIAVDKLGTMDELRGELACLLFHAVVGTSRLPLNSVEAPVPDFSFGRLGYFFQPSAASSDEGPTRSWRSLLERTLHGELSRREMAKLLELVIRAIEAHEVPDAAEHFVSRWRAIGRKADEIPALLRTVFNEVSLSPYTDFVDKTFAFLQELVDGRWLDVEEQIDFVGFLLRQLGRHLTAYDLVTFHYRGANYPDALLLDAALKAYVRLAEKRAALFEGTSPRHRLRRRALRQGCLFRRHYEGHLVPDVPTSPGENARVLSAPHLRVPEEQILQTTRRRRRLFADDPLPCPAGVRDLLERSLADLDDPRELRELGTAVFVDRPLGANKLPGEPDQTPLLAQEAFGRSVAMSRLDEIAGWARALGVPFDAVAAKQRLAALEVGGLPVTTVPVPKRPTVSLADACRVAEDFVALRTLPGGLGDLRAALELCGPEARPALDLLVTLETVLVVLQPSSSLPDREVVAILGSDHRRRAEIHIDAAQGFRTRRGLEYPRMTVHAVE